MREKGKITRGDILLSGALAAVIVLIAALPYRMNIPALPPGSWKLSTLSVILSFFLLTNVCRIFFSRRKAGVFLRIFLILLGLLAFLRLPMAAEGNERPETVRSSSGTAEETPAAHGPYSATVHTQGK